MTAQPTPTRRPIVVDLDDLAVVIAGIREAEEGGDGIHVDREHVDRLARLVDDALARPRMTAPDLVAVDSLDIGRISALLGRIPGGHGAPRPRGNTPRVEDLAAAGTLVDYVTTLVDCLVRDTDNAAAITRAAAEEAREATARLRRLEAAGAAIGELLGLTRPALTD